MCTTRITANKKGTSEKCWVCTGPATESVKAATKVWCRAFHDGAPDILPKISGGERDLWTDDYAKTYADELCKAIIKSKDGGNKGKKLDEKAVNKPDASDDSNSREQDNGVDKCELCGGVCGDDRMGRETRVSPSVGSPVFHRACRHKMLMW